MPPSLKACVNEAIKRFTAANLVFGHGTDNARDEAIYLILHTLQLSLDTPIDSIKDTLTPQQEKNIEAIITKRIETRLPAAYLTHEAFFMGLPFYVDERVLIPRSPMAEIIQQKFEPWILEKNIHAVLDLCTGSGCIAIAMAMAMPGVDVVASDISKDALTVAEINLRKYQLENQIKLYESDLFDNIPSQKKQKFDVIISNPPYVDREDMESLPKEYFHEPELALTGGEDGLVLVKKILKHAKNYLSDHGILIVEVGNSAEALMRQFPKVPFIWLEFEHGEAEVFLLAKEDIPSYA